MKESQPTYLLFDFETDGIGQTRQQKAVELAWVIVDQHFNIISKHEYYFRSVDYINTSFHGKDLVHLLETKATKRSKILKHFLRDVYKVYQNNGKLVAHNIEFDLHILSNECKSEYLNVNFDIIYALAYCTMKHSTHLCKLPSKRHKNQFKFPKLEEVYTHLFHKQPEIQLHRALNDVLVMFECFRCIFKPKTLTTMFSKLSLKKN